MIRLFVADASRRGLPCAVAVRSLAPSRLGPVRAVPEIVIALVVIFMLGGGRARDDCHLRAYIVRWVFFFLKLFFLFRGE